jgi:hypothetical protein
MVHLPSVGEWPGVMTARSPPVSSCVKPSAIQNTIAHFVSVEPLFGLRKLCLRKRQHGCRTPKAQIDVQTAIIQNTNANNTASL